MRLRRACGLQIRALISGEDAPDLSEAEEAVARFARRLSIDASVDDAAFGAVSAHMDERQVVELTLLVGLYNLVSRVASGLHVDLDGDARRLLDSLGVER